MEIEVIQLGVEESGIINLYKSDTTRELDRRFNLTGPTITEEQKENLIIYGVKKSNRDEAKLPLTFLLFLAGQVGYFVGVPYKTLEYGTKGNSIKKSIEAGYLQTYIHKGMKVIEPTLKLSEITNELSVISS